MAGVNTARILHLSPAGDSRCKLCGKELGGKLEAGEYWLAGDLRTFRTVQIYGYVLCKSAPLID